MKGEPAREEPVTRDEPVRGLVRKDEAEPGSDAGAEWTWPVIAPGAINFKTPLLPVTRS